MPTGEPEKGANLPQPRSTVTDQGSEIRTGDSRNNNRNVPGSSLLTEIEATWLGVHADVLYL